MKIRLFALGLLCSVLLCGCAQQNAGAGTIAVTPVETTAAARSSQQETVTQTLVKSIASEGHKIDIYGNSDNSVTIRTDGDETSRDSILSAVSEAIENPVTDTLLASHELENGTLSVYMGNDNSLRLVFPEGMEITEDVIIDTFGSLPDVYISRTTDTALLTTSYGDVECFAGDDGSITIRFQDGSRISEAAFTEIVSQMLEVPIPAERIKRTRTGRSTITAYSTTTGSTVIELPAGFDTSEESLKQALYALFDRDQNVSTIGTISTYNGEIKVSSEGNSFKVEYTDGLKLDSSQFLSYIANGFNTGKLRLADPQSTTVDLSPRTSEDGTVYRIIRGNGGTVSYVELSSYKPDQNNELRECTITFNIKSRTITIQVTDAEGNKERIDGRKSDLEDAEGNLLAVSDYTSRDRDYGTSQEIKSDYSRMLYSFLANDSIDLMLNRGTEQWHFEYDRMVLNEMVKSCGGHFFFLEDGQTITLKEGITTIKEKDIQGAVKALVIPAGVVNIGASAFRGCTELESVIIPDTVTFIGDSAFSRCTALKEIIIPDSVTKIGKSAFSGCKELTSISLPAGLNTISESMFSECTSLELEGIRTTGEITVIGDYAFSKCTAVETLSIPATVTSIGSHAFEGCTSLTTLYIPSSVTVIGDSAFRDCSALSKVELSEGVKEIQRGAFSNCTSLTEISIPEGVETLGTRSTDQNRRWDNYGVFTNCTALTAINLPLSLKYIEPYAFSGCTALKSLVIPEGVTEAGANMLQGCTELESVIIGGSLETIPEGLFNGLKKLSSVTVREGVRTIGQNAFNSCSSLKSISLPSTLTSIERGAFSYTGFEAITLPASLEVIGAEAFRATPLRSIELPDSVREMSSNTFQDCNELESVVIGGGMEHVPAEAFRARQKLSEVILKEGVKSIGDNAFRECSALLSIRFPSTLTTIGTASFRDAGLVEMELNEGIRNIGVEAFRWCDFIRVVIPEGTERLEDRSFFDCTSLESIIIPESVTYIGNGALGRCFPLSISYKGTQEQWDAISKGDWTQGYSRYDSRINPAITYEYTEADQTTV